MSDNQIQVNKYVYFDTGSGYFYLTSDANEMIYRKKNLICSYSGANEWVHHFVCEMLDFCSGSSPYNYALGSYKHETKFPEAFKTNKDQVIAFVKRTVEEPWSKKMYKFIETIIEETDPV
jgi:hypothetical protein